MCPQILGCLLIYGTVKVTAYSLQQKQLVCVCENPGPLRLVRSAHLKTRTCLSPERAELSAFGTPGLGWAWVFSLGVLGISCLGIYAGCSENALALKIVHCCGVVSSGDWGDTIPQSCECTYGGRELAVFGASGRCKARPAGTAGPEQIYEEPCSNVIFSYVDLIFKFAMGFFFGFTVTALLGLLVCLLMIHQVKRHDMAGGASIPMKGY
ncbi:hypothetical protein F2P81_017885 [Scophthalmus maximus]|uniref:Uncharacterized protein n=1 Tax=Scophthalmus maximus TaxID=52904 RepID=A0A6A4SAS8_SCOMX|nr:hypothetical protein F2P81_017885 [Scophthalmus maximus]